MKFLLLNVLLFLNCQINYSQTIDSSLFLEDAPKVFIDGGYDLDHVRREIIYVNYMRDRYLADVFVLVTSRRTGSGGEEYTLTFTGQNRFANMNDTILYNTKSFDSEDIQRKIYIKNLKLGLLPYILKTPIASQLVINCESEGVMEQIKDDWDYWVFRLRAGGFYTEEQYREMYYLSGDVDVDRITEDWKIRLEADVDYDEDKITYEYEEDSTKIITSATKTSSRRWSVDGDVVMSISNNWSIGLYSSIYSSTYRNINLAYFVTPAIEFNIFPYKESTYREIRLSYSAGLDYRNYYEETIYDKLSEILYGQSVEIVAMFRQHWGTLKFAASYSNYLNDFSKNRFQMWGGFEINIFEGFAIDLSGSYSSIHDQLSLPKGSASFEEILLRRSELATQYSYDISIGFSYTFGAVYNNVVNPRFGD
jgi:hypothetical protein